MASTAPLWVVIAAILIAIDLGARATPGGPGALAGAGIGALCGGVVAGLGMAPAHQASVAALTGAAGVLLVPRILQDRQRRSLRSQPPREQSEIFIGEDGAPRVVLQAGTYFAELEERGHLSAGLPVEVLARRDNVAVVRPLQDDGRRPPPPLSRCRTMR